MISKYAMGTVLVLAVWSSAGAADESAVERLQKEIERRDRVILELLERVDALERRVGMKAGVQAGAGGGDASTSAARPRDALRAPAGDGAVTAAREPVPEAPGRIVVDEEAAERALERSLTQTGGLLLGPGQIEVSPSLSYARDEDGTPVLVGLAGGASVAERERNADTLTADLALRFGLPRDAQLELGLPYRWRHVENVTTAGLVPIAASSVTGSGLGDLRIGAAKTLFRERLWRPDLVGRITWDTGTGRRSDDGVSLGGDFDELRGSLTAVKRHDPVVFVGSVAFEHVFEDGGIQPGQSVSSSFGGFVALSPETSLRLLFSGGYRAETEVLGSSIDGSDGVTGTFVAGGSTLLVPGLLVDLSVGIGLTEDADDFSVTLSLPVRFDWRSF